jgi:uncharacterized LabA/DUF88 family protein
MLPEFYIAESPLEMTMSQVAPRGPQKLRIFVDFWNFQLALNRVAPDDYRLDWLTLSQWLTERTKDLVLSDPSERLQSDGVHVYISYNSQTEKGRNLHKWATNVLARFPGFRVVCVERKAKGPPTCPSCHRHIEECPHCGGKIIRTIEKGIDTAIVTDIITLAFEDAWDAAVLVSSDRDFIPAVNYLAQKGHKVVHAGFPPSGMDLASACWASIDIRTGLSDISR